LFPDSFSFFGIPGAGGGVFMELNPMRARLLTILIASMLTGGADPARAQQAGKIVELMTTTERSRV